MSRRVEKAMARAGAIDRAEQYLNEANVALTKAREELKTVNDLSQDGCQSYNSAILAADYLSESIENINKL